jgi:hypothetical protein
MTTKDMIISIVIIKKRKLTIKKHQKGLGMTKVVFLLSMVPPNVGLQEKRMLYIIIKKI